MKTTIPNNKSIITFFETQEQSEEAINKLHKNGFDLQSFSIVAIDLCEIENVKGYYTLFDNMKRWGKIGSFYGGFWGLLFGATTFSIPFIGRILIAGPLTVILITFVCALATGILSALGAALYYLTFPEKHKLKYEKEITAEKYMLLTKGNGALIAKAREILGVRISKDFLIPSQ